MRFIFEKSEFFIVTGSFFSGTKLQSIRKYGLQNSKITI